MSSENLVEITGKCTFTKFRKEDNSYCVCIYETRKGDTFCAVGSDLPDVKYPVTLLGQWITDPKYGKQFKVASVLNPLPCDSSADIIEFLSSLKIGIGKKRATEMLQLTGPQHFWKTLEDTPERFTSLPGISEKTITKLQSATANMRLRTELIKLFDGKLSMTPSQFAAVKMTFRNELDTLTQRIQNDPFCLILAGYDFQELDLFAEAQGNYKPNANERIFAAIYQTLVNAEGQAHAGLPIDIALRETMRLLNRKGRYVQTDFCRQLIWNPPVDWPFIASCGLLYREDSWNQENKIAVTLMDFQSRKTRSVSSAEVQRYIRQYELDKQIQLAPAQKKAIRNVFCCGVNVITGGPGTGKSTILDTVLYCWNQIYRNEDWILLAPTGRAAKRIRETTGQPAFTIHSAIEIRVNENDNELCTEAQAGASLSQQLIIVDEASMIDQMTMSALLGAIQHPEPRLILVGDPEQLPPVRTGNVLGDIINSNVVPVSKLTTIFRQAEENPIVANAAQIRNGSSELVWNKLFKRCYYPTEQENLDKFCQFYLRCIQSYGIDQVILLTPYRRNNTMSAQALNKRLQSTLNPDLGKPSISYGQQVFRLHDRVMQIRNNYNIQWETADGRQGTGIFNGDIGTILNIDFTREMLTIQFDDMVADYPFSQLNELELAYCQTIHKSQGSQYRVVLLLLPDRVTPFLRRNLLYTAITRATDYVAICGSLSTVDYCIRNDSKDTRYTRLTDRLTQLAANNS